VQPTLSVGDHLIRATYSGYEKWAASSEEMTQRVVVAATASIKPTTFFPVVDDYKDVLVIKGERNVAASVAIAIRAVSDGALVREAAVASATGAYRWTWDGQASNGASAPAALLPAGQYDVTVILTDAASDTMTVDKRITLSLDFVEWKTKTKVLDGRAFWLVARSRNANISVGRSNYPKGVFLASKKGLAAVVYGFKVPESKIIGSVTFKVQGRSRNRHKALIAVWNPGLGGSRSLAAYDAAKAVGSRFKWWKTTATGQGHVKKGKARTTILVFKGLGGKGNATFDVKKVKLIFRVGTLQNATGAAVASTLRDAIVSRLTTRGPDGRTVTDVADRSLPKLTKAPALVEEEPDDAVTDTPPQHQPAITDAGPAEPDPAGATPEPEASAESNAEPDTEPGGRPVPEPGQDQPGDARGEETDD